MIEYPMCTNYVEKWNIWEAVREFLQNAMDSGKYDYTYAKGTLTITNEGKLDRSVLLLGKSVKDFESSRGQFGEGMKLAMMVLSRMNRRCVIYSGTEKWLPKIDYSETFDHMIFMIDIEKKRCKGVRVEIEVTTNEMKMISEKWTHAPYGILEGRRKGLIFVGGLYACTIKGLTHAYNFSPSDITLNRDRDIPSMWDIQHATIRYLTDEEILELALEGKKDVADSYSASNKITAAWSRNYDGYIPVGFSEQGKVEAPAGFKIKIVPDWIADAIRGAKTFVVKYTGTTISRLEDWHKNHCWHVPSKAQKDLQSIIEDLKNERSTASESETNTRNEQARDEIPF